MLISDAEKALMDITGDYPGAFFDEESQMYMEYLGQVGQ